LSFISELHAALNITGPVLLLLILGLVLKRTRFINEDFIAQGNKIVFNIALPSLLFLNISSSSLSVSLDTPLIAFACVATVLSVIAVWLLSPIMVEKEKRGVFTQCAFRGNMAIIGLSLCENALGQDSLAVAAIYLAFLTTLYNVLSVMLLNSSCKGLVVNIAKNPLIISILLGVVWSYLTIPLPVVVESSLAYITKMTLPLALICIGATLEWRSFKSNHRSAIYATLLKLLLLPFCIIYIAKELEFDQTQLTLLFFMMASPTAAAAYVMSKQMTKYGNLAAEVVTLSTLFSPITLTIGILLIN
jgi:malonate transporter